MNGELNLVAVARDLLAIHEDLPFRLKKMKKYAERDFTMETFTQIWGNTSGGFEGMGGCAIVEQRTYVFIPSSGVDEDCLVYFGGAFGYSVPYSSKFMEDVRDRSVKGVMHRGIYTEK